MKFVILN